jgi:hypothetical protein
MSGSRSRALQAAGGLAQLGQFALHLHRRIHGLDLRKGLGEAARRPACLAASAWRSARPTVQAYDLRGQCRALASARRAMRGACKGAPAALPGGA